PVAVRARGQRRSDPDISKRLGLTGERVPYESAGIVSNDAETSDLHQTHERIGLVRFGEPVGSFDYSGAQSSSEPRTSALQSMRSRLGSFCEAPPTPGVRSLGQMSSGRGSRQNSRHVPD